jgi:hypothetical protein
MQFLPLAAFRLVHGSLPLTDPMTSIAMATSPLPVRPAETNTGEVQFEPWQQLPRSQGLISAAPGM